MSHPRQNLIHPLHLKPAVSPLPRALWAVREPGPDEEIPSLIDLTDGITERLDKAEAISRLLISEEAALEFLPAAAWAIADLIREARELHHRQWRQIRPGIGDKAPGPDGDKQD